MTDLQKIAIKFGPSEKQLEQAREEGFKLGFQLALHAMREHDNEHSNIFIALEKANQALKEKPDSYFQHMASVAWRVTKHGK